MLDFDPVENDERIRKGIVAVIAHKALEFSQQRPTLVTIFDDPFTRFSRGRVVLFQEHIYNLTGIPPVLVKCVPACFKAYFTLEADSARTDAIYCALQSKESKEVYRSIGVSQVQYGAHPIITPNL